MYSYRTFDFTLFLCSWSSNFGEGKKSKLDISSLGLSSSKIECTDRRLAVILKSEAEPKMTKRRDSKKQARGKKNKKNRVPAHCRKKTQKSSNQTD